MVLLLMIAVGLIGANSLILSPIASEVAAGLGLADAADVMSAAAAYGAGVSLSALLLAPLADRIGADTALKHSLILIAAALGISAAAPNLDVLIASQSLAGIGVGLALPSIYTMAAVISVPGQEARTIGKVLTGWTLAMVGGVTLSAYIADFFGWRMVFSVLAIAVFAVLTFMYAVQLPAAPRSEKVTSPISALRVAGLGGALFCVAMFGAGFYGVYNYLGAHITETLGRSVSDSGQFTLLYGLGFGLAMFFDRYLDRVGPKRAMAVIFAALIVLFAVAYQIVNSYTLFAALMFVWGIINHFGLNMTVSRLNQLGPSQRGAIMGLNSAVMYLCIFVATIGFRPLFDTWGLGACIIASGIMAILGLVEALYARSIVKRTFLTKELI